MTAIKRRGRLADALLNLLPNSEIESYRETDWHSATFSGIRCEITMLLPGENAAERAKAFHAMLPDHEFHLPRHIVADIEVAKIIEADASFRLTIEALLLNE